MVAVAVWMARRPQRLPNVSYCGLQRYSLTICTHRRCKAFTDAAVVKSALAGIARAAVDHQFAVTAYCFMPDHLHLLVEGIREDSNLLTFTHALKQRTGYRFRDEYGQTLWQKGYHEHIVRDDESAVAIARYIVANPVRARLVVEPRDYPFSGSLVFGKEQLDDLWQAGTP